MIWTREGDRLVTLSGHSDQVFNASFSPRGDRVMTSSRDNTVRLWDSAGTLVQTIDFSPVYAGQVYCARFSPDGELIVAASRDGRISLRSANRDLLALLDAHTDIADDVVVSPDGRCVASASRDDTAILWQLNFAAIEKARALWNLDLDGAIRQSEEWAGDFLRGSKRPGARQRGVGAVP
jgi:WD40 repeat protein